jgi:hypothetical protein
LKINPKAMAHITQPITTSKTRHAAGRAITGANSRAPNPSAAKNVNDDVTAPAQNPTSAPANRDAIDPINTRVSK